MSMPGFPFTVFTAVYSDVFRICSTSLNGERGGCFFFTSCRLSGTVTVNGTVTIGEIAKF